MKEKSSSGPFDQLSKPARRALANAGVKTLQQLSALTEQEFMHLHGIGKTTLPILKTAMAANNLSFATDDK
ncbi:hypothetical protein BH09BAC6_BH09BAC6_24810 [soil metagenome]|jgi:DNA-directed RNA polymerase alpha subunit